MPQKLRGRVENERGFTLIELLVVILIIGILAAVAIPAFLNQRQKAYDAQAKSNVRTAQVAEETYATDNGGSYTSAVTGSGASSTDPLVQLEPTLKQDPAVTATAATPATTGYTLVATSVGSTPVTYTLTMTNGSVSRTCSPAGKGSCSASSTW
jgi:type IV pilus assembly protein PilA